MKFKKQIARALTALIMLTVFMLPVAIEFFHVLEGHEHQVCDDSSDHFHESVLDCSVFHVQQQTFHYDFTYYPELSAILFSSHIEAVFSPLVLDSYVHTNNQLRAPPVIS